ncbi:MAG: phosphoribosylamine--glycine ligase, partial [Candidatus Zixiibacteriota bacterium]
ISQLAQCVDIRAESVKELAQYAHRNRIDLTVVGPEAPLAGGIVDEFRRRNLKIFGPTRAASQLEWSKAFSKEFMRRHHIPTGSFRIYNDPTPAITFCRTAEYPLVIKADGLAAGKGVVVVDSFEEARKTIDLIMQRRCFGRAGTRIVIEEFLRGVEVSVMCLTDGERIWPLLPSQDHKRIGEGDTGPNTGGMGAYCPVAAVDSSMMGQIFERVLKPCISGLAQEGTTYKGVLYAGLMLTEGGPKVLEFNCRFGDPETQAVLPLLKSDLARIMLEIAKHTPPGESKGASKNRNKTSKKKADKAVEKAPEGAGPVYLRDLIGEYEPGDESEDEKSEQGPLSLEWAPGAAATITLASANYPGKPLVGKKISGIASRGIQAGSDGVVFHAGTKKINDVWVNSGGRALNVTGLGADVPEALERAYEIVSKVSFDGMQFRRDIGHQVTGRKASGVPEAPEPVE